MTYRFAPVIVPDSLTSPRFNKQLLSDESRCQKLDAQPHDLLCDLIVRRNIKRISHRQGMLVLVLKQNVKFD